MAVVELSVGAGLVTILFVFAINIAGEETLPAHSLIPRPLAWGLVIVSVLLLGWFALPPLLQVLPALDSTPFSQVAWGGRGLDMLLQVALIFTGVLGVVGLLVDRRRPLPHNPQGVLHLRTRMGMDWHRPGRENDPFNDPHPDHRGSGAGGGGFLRPVDLTRNLIKVVIALQILVKGFCWR